MSDVRGVGIDLCGISRFETLLDSDAFLERSFTQAEIGYIRSRGVMAASSMAAMWAAKEAALKSFGVGISLSLRDVEIHHDETGRPSYCLHGKAQELACGGSLLLSLTHEGDTAAAVCVWSV